MTTPLRMITGTPSMGAEVLRERLRWMAAERRWQAPGGTVPPTSFVPPLGSGQQALWEGARLAEFGQAAVST